MRKCEKKRLKRIRHHELVCKTREVLRKEYGRHDQFNYNPTNEMLVAIVQGLKTKYLRVITANTLIFSKFLAHDDLFRLANDEIALRALKIEKT